MLEYNSLFGMREVLNSAETQQVVVHLLSLFSLTFICLVCTGNPDYKYLKWDYGGVL